MKSNLKPMREYDYQNYFNKKRMNNIFDFSLVHSRNHHLNTLIQIIGEAMRILRLIYLFVFIMLILSTNCQKGPEQKLEQFNNEFFAKYVPEFPDAQLMTKVDVPEHQQEFFDEADGKLQLLFDLNKNDTPEYIICGISKSMKERGEKAPYFLTIFENTDTGIKRLYLHKLLVPPVSLDISKDKKRNGIIVLFAFFSDFAAEIYYENNEYHVEKLF